MEEERVVHGKRDFTASRNLLYWTYFLLQHFSFNRDVTYICISLFLFIKYQNLDICHHSVHLFQYTSLYTYTMDINEVAESEKSTIKNVNIKYEGICAKCQERFLLKTCNLYAK